MTATTQTDPLLPRFVPALCCECGAVRQAGFRNASAGPERPLKCSACGRQTTHAIIAPEGWDYREKSNREANGMLAKIARNIDHIRSMGILVDDGRPQGGKCMINHYLEPDEDGPEWRVIVQEGLPVDVLRRVVTWAWQVMLPSYVDDYDKAWNGAVCRDEYGESRGCYYTGD